MKVISTPNLCMALLVGFVAVAQAQAACVAGKVYLDSNGNQMEDAGEKGLAGVRLYTSSGIFIVTDQEGRYSYCARDGRTSVVKVDTTSLKSVCSQKSLDARTASGQIVPSTDGAVGRELFAEESPFMSSGGLGRTDFGLRCR